MSKDAVQNYIDLLEKSYIIFELAGYGGNLRSEVTRSRKYYFVDNGVRNTVIDDLRPLDARNDAGALWENFCVSERRKVHAALGSTVSSYFWRTYSGSEIDYIESGGGALRAYEFKYGSKKPRMPAPFAKAYPHAEYAIVSPDSFLGFMTAL